MAEPPSSEGRSGPPPVPGRRATSTPPPLPDEARAKEQALQPDPTLRADDTGNTAGVDDVDDREATRPVAAPDNARLVETIIELISAEAEMLLSSSDDESDVMLADINARLGIFSWDVLEDAEAATRFFDLAETHPLAPLMALQQALTLNDTDALEGAQSAIEASSSSARAGMMVDIAEAWLFRHQNPSRATETATVALSWNIDADTRRELTYLLRLGFAVGQDWNELADHFSTRALEADAQPDEISEATHIVAHRLDDAARAGDIFSTSLGSLVSQSSASPVIAYSALWSAFQVAAGVDTELDVPSLLQSMLALAEGDAGADREANAQRFRLAQIGVDNTAALLRALSADDAAAWGARLAAITLLDALYQVGDWPAVVAQLTSMAKKPGGGAYAAAYERLAAEVLDARVEDATAALAQWRQVLRRSPDDDQALRSVERLLIGRPETDLVAHFQAVARAVETRKSVSLRRASAIAESRSGDLALATRLRKASLENAADPSGFADLARLYRASRERAQLAEVYRLLAGADKDKRVGATLLCAAGALELSRGRIAEAEEAFVEATRRAPKDPTARVALVAIYRRAARWKDLARALSDLSPLLVHEGSRVNALRELGGLYASQLKDPRRARTTLDQALELDPDDGDTLHSLAELYDQAREWDKSVALRQRAVDVFESAVRRASLLMEIGGIEEQYRRDDEAALVALERAFEVDPASIPSLQAQQRIHGRLQRHDELLGVLRAELELVTDGSRRLSIQLEIASLSRDEEDSDSALEAYQSALELDRENRSALDGIRDLARAKGRWETLATAFAAAPKTPENLRVLSEALAKQDKWAEFAATRLQEIELLTAEDEKAVVAQEVAETYEQKLDDVANAIRLYQRALSFQPAARESQRSLARLLEGAQRWHELAAAYEQELTTVQAEDIERQIGLLIRLGEIRRGNLSKPGDAALAFEAVLERQPHHVPTLEALEELYERLGREKDLLRVLEARAAATDDRMERAQLYTRTAQVHEGRQDGDAALRAYKAAFQADPANRETFTALEKLSYKQERWNEVMELYTGAIKMVEEEGSRAYRLGDLYARRGQVQLQYLHELGEAAASYLRVIELDPDNDTAVKFLESIFSQQGDWAGLITAYEKRAELTGDDERRLETLRRAARVAGAKLKDPAEATRIYELILKVDSTDREALDALERFHERAGDWNKLVDVLKLRLDSAPAGDAATALLKRIAQICEEGLRDEARAIEHYLRILEIAPGNKGALEALGRIYESTEAWAEFIDVTRRQIRITTDRNVKALLYFKCGSVMEAKFSKEEDAIRYYDAAIKTSPSCLPAVHGLRDLYRRRMDWPRVIQTLELEVKLWQDDKERAGVFAQIGRIYSQMLHQPERAMHYYESALAVDPECLPANRALFEHYFATGEWQRAQPLAQALAQKAMREGDPSQRSEFYRKRGIVARMVGDMRSAAESLIISLEIKPINLDSLDALGELAKADPNAYDFAATYRELDKIYKKRDDARAYVARVRVAQAVMTEREGDLDAAEGLYAEASELSPDDFTILSALVELHANMRRWTHAVDALVRFLESTPPPADDIRVLALMRQAEIHGDCEMDPHKAASVLREVIRIQPNHQMAPYKLAQELYLLQRFGEARQAIERVIELAAAPGTDVQPENLARYYYYLGRIIEASGDPRPATSKYRRAAEYDPGYAPPVLALAKRSAEAGDQRQAESLLINAAHAAMEAGGAEAAVPLQRGLARILLASGDRPAAIEAYRGILAVEPDGGHDRVALAEIYAVDDLPKAIAELKKVIDRDIRHAPAYRMLASFYARTGEADRSSRVLSAMEILGFAEEQDRGAAAKARAAQQHVPLRRQMDADLRAQLLVTEAAATSYGEIYTAIASEVTALFPRPAMGQSLQPIQNLDDPAFKVAIADMVRLFGAEPEIYIGENIPGGMTVLAFPRPLMVIDRELLTEQDAARRFLLGYAFEGIRGAYSLLFSLGRRQRNELGSLMRSLTLPESERAAPTNEFIRSLSKRAIKTIDQHAGKKRDVDFDEWVETTMATAKRAGLFACDDFVAATRMIGRLSGENLGVGLEGTTALGAVLGGADLVRFYLSDEYHRLREILSNPMPMVGSAQ